MTQEAITPSTSPEAGAEPVPTVDTPAIRIRHLWHRFADRDVLQDVTFEVGRGEIFGFIGPNGAGKTTTIRIISTLLEPMAGRVEVEGVDVALDPERVRRLVGYMPDNAGIYERVTVREYLDFFARAYAVPDRGVVDTVIELVGLQSLHERLIADLSKGMKQRLQVARILLHDPKVLVLDEPASDLDPRARIELRDLLLELRELGKTVFLSSHILTELSDVCSSIGILEHGRLLVAGPINEISSRLSAVQSGAMPPQSSSPLGPHGTLPPPALPAQPQLTPAGAVVPSSATRRMKIRLLGDTLPAAQLLWTIGGVTAIEPGAGGWLLVQYVGDEMYVANVVGRLVTAGHLVVGVEPERNELERIFLEVTRGDLK